MLNRCWSTLECVLLGWYWENHSHHFEMLWLDTWLDTLTWHTDLLQKQSHCAWKAVPSQQNAYACWDVVATSLHHYHESVLFMQIEAVRQEIKTQSNLNTGVFFFFFFRFRLTYTSWGDHYLLCPQTGLEIIEERCMLLITPELVWERWHF